MTIGIWGDSITYGLCDQEALGWVGRLRKFLPTDDYHHLYNFGICGESSANVLKRFQIECDAIEPEKVVFAIGINDSKYPDGGTVNMVSLEEYKANMIKLITAAKQSAKEVVLVGPTCIGGEFRTPRASIFQDSEIMKYRDVLKEIAQEQNLQFIDMFDVLDPKSDLGDGVHPNIGGYQKMFEKIKSELSWS